MLLHDTSASSSVLNQLGEKEDLKFVDTALYIDPRNLMPTNTGLVMMRATAGVGGKYVAPLGDGPPSRVRAPQVFRPWWENDLMCDNVGNLWNRKRITLSLANKEGGAHVDPSLSDNYENLVARNGLGYRYSDSTGEYDFQGNAVAASVRQIAYEVIQSLEAANIQ